MSLLATPKSYFFSTLLGDSGFTSLDELLTKALESMPSGAVAAPQPQRAKLLVDVLMSLPFGGSGLTIERLKQEPPPAIVL